MLPQEQESFKKKMVGEILSTLYMHYTLYSGFTMYKKLTEILTMLLTEKSYGTQSKTPLYILIQLFCMKHTFSLFKKRYSIGRNVIKHLFNAKHLCIVFVI